MKKSLAFVKMIISLMVFGGCLMAPNVLRAQEFKSFFGDSQGPGHKALAPHKEPPLPCRGKILQVQDAAFEGVKITPSNWSIINGGGEVGRFDPMPVLTAKVQLKPGCLNAHLSAMVGSRATYGAGISSIAMFQVTLTPAGTVSRQHMVGHYDTPYGIYEPSVAIEAERDVDMYASNFYQPIGVGPNCVPPHCMPAGAYNVDVWWAGGPATPGGAIGAAFVLKLFHR